MLLSLHLAYFHFLLWSKALNRHFGRHCSRNFRVNTRANGTNSKHVNWVSYHFKRLKLSVSWMLCHCNNDNCTNFHVECMKIKFAQILTIMKKNHQPRLLYWIIMCDKAIESFNCPKLLAIWMSTTFCHS